MKIIIQLPSSLRKPSYLKGSVIRFQCLLVLQNSLENLSPRLRSVEFGRQAKCASRLGHICEMRSRPRFYPGYSEAGH